MTTNAPDGHERHDIDHDQDSDPPTPFGEEPGVPNVDPDSEEPGSDPDPKPGSGD